MGLTTKKILERYNDCDSFSLTGKIVKYKFTIPEEEYIEATKDLGIKEIEEFDKQFATFYKVTKKDFQNAINNIKEKEKKELKQLYKSYKEELKDYPSFEDLYIEIEKECKDFDNKENRQFYINKHLC